MRNSVQFAIRLRGEPVGGAVEVIALVGLVGFFVLLFLMWLPRGRESSRMIGCQKNLMQIGVGLQLYHSANRQFPTVGPLGSSMGDSPIKALLDGLAVPDLLELRDPTQAPKPLASPPRGIRVPGLACPSDFHAIDRRVEPMISYRASTGDHASGLGGPFQPGRTITSDQVDAADGLSFTAGFAERLVGDAHDQQVRPNNYAQTPGPISDDGCPSAAPDRWRGDAGSDWAEASWRSTLYNHVLLPNGSPSCIAEDGKTAVIGASSAHLKRVNVLMLDGSLRGVTPTIDPKVWRSMGSVGP